jgi:S1-C subfamily serine protease
MSKLDDELIDEDDADHLADDRPLRIDDELFDAELDSDDDVLDHIGREHDGREHDGPDHHGPSRDVPDDTGRGDGGDAAPDDTIADDALAGDGGGPTDDVDDTRARPDAVARSRRSRRREWRRVERARRYAARRSVRFPIFTRSVLLWMLLFALVGVATGASSAFFWAHFNTQISELREQTNDFDKRSSEAQGQIETMRNQALTDIDERLKPLAADLAAPRIIQNAGQLSPYVWFVATLDANGYPAVGSAFTIRSDERTALLVTSLSTVQAATIAPAPDIELRKNADVIKARLVNWDAAHDVALLAVDRGGLPVFEWASDDDQSKLLGTRVFAISGLGGAGASATDGTVVDQSQVGFLHDAAIGTAAQGGPIINGGGKVVGIASIAYRPLGFDPGQTRYSIPVNQLCLTLLECGGGTREPRS